MWLIAGVAAGATTALMWWRRISVRDDATHIIANMRRQSGVLTAIVNCINALLDALALLRRIAPTTTGVAGPIDFARAAEAVG